jgi:hypothetical protein
MTTRSQSVPMLSARRLARWLSPLVCLGAVACGPGADDIVELDVKLTTGAKDSDQDMYFCYTRDGSGSRFECLELSSSGDDFETDTRELFELEPDEAIPVEGSEFGLSNIFIENRGGGFGSDGWDLVALEVRALYGDDSESLICSESSIAVRLNSSDKYDPPACP